MLILRKSAPRAPAVVILIRLAGTSHGLKLVLLRCRATEVMSRSSGRARFRHYATHAMTAQSSEANERSADELVQIVDELATSRIANQAADPLMRFFEMFCGLQRNISGDNHMSGYPLSCPPIISTFLTTMCP